MIKKLCHLLFILIVNINLLIFFATPTQAADSDCTLETDPAIITVPGTYVPDRSAITITYKIKVADPGEYQVVLQDGWGSILPIGMTLWDPVHTDSNGYLVTKDNKPLTQTIRSNNWQSNIFQPGEHPVYVRRKGVDGNYCVKNYRIQKVSPTEKIECNIYGPTSPNSSTEISLSGTVSPSRLYRLKVGTKISSTFRPDKNNNIPEQKFGIFNPGTYPVILETGVAGNFAWENTNCKIDNIVVKSTQDNPNPNLTKSQIGSGKPKTITTENSLPTSQSKIRATGDPCRAEDDEAPISTGINTAIGCISTDPVGLVRDFFRLAVGIGGGIALLLMILGAFQMVSSAGNPEEVKHGKERFVSAIEGLLFVVFSILLLRIIGVDILGFGQFLGIPTP